MEELRQAKADHLAEGQEAKDAYKQVYVNGSHVKYTMLTEQFNGLPRAAFSSAGIFDASSAEAGKVTDFLDVASGFKAGLDTDYQMDKFAPNWGKSGQPGPTYFMSHITYYVHMTTTRTLGDLAGPGRLDANRFYTREQAGVSKNSNDTVSTVFHRLHEGAATFKPPMFRTGFDVNGLIPGAGGTTAAAPVPVAPAPAAPPVLPAPASAPAAAHVHVAPAPAAPPVPPAPAPVCYFV
jgi:hypothetical protein